ncbi:MAG TPA: RimK family alpha-L-glutamate ligase [Pseudogracilibacillus sp.]|nr:RimK family alpha-L-glutamate ligase [Pseudogracilibacillus sp.]
MIYMSLKGWIVYNGFLNSDKFLDFAQMFQDAAIDKGHDVTLFTNEQLMNLISNTAWTHNKPDYLIFTDKDIYLAKQLELNGIRVFNQADVIEVSDDKIKTYQLLDANHIAIPKTIVAPKTYLGTTAFTDDLINHVIDTLHFPMVIKEAFGSFGEQVYLVHDKEQLFAQLKTVKEPFMFQEFIESSYGKDIRIQVVGKRVVAAMLRQSKDDFRANITSGGQMKPYQPTQEEADAAIKASLAIGADFSGVDILFGHNNKPIVCEVNSNAHIRNLLDCTGINAAIPIIEYIEETVK